MKEITAQQLEQLLKENKHIDLIDVREPFEVKLGKVPEAENIPLQQFLSEIDQLDKDKEYILICRSGNRSGIAGQFLEMQGYKAVNVVDGMIGWQGKQERNLS